MILESKKGSRVDHFSTREIKIITYLKVFFFWEGERYEILRETSDGASRRGKELRLIEISTFYILLRLAGQHRKRTGNTVDDNGDKIYGEVQCARIFKNEKKKRKCILLFNFQIVKSNRFTFVKAEKLRANLFVDSFSDNVERKNGDARFSRIEKPPLLSISEAVKSNGCNLMDYRTPRY